MQFKRIVHGMGVAIAAALGSIEHARAAELPAVEVSTAIATRMHWIGFHMISGRVVGSSNLTVPKTFVQSQSRRSRQRQTLSIEISAGVCGMQYDSLGADERLRITLSASDELQIERKRPNDRYALEFKQSADRPLVLVIEESETRRHYEASGFWRLYLDQPQVVRDHLVPLLELLRPSWQLAASGAEIEDLLIHSPPAPKRGDADRTTWSRLVAELASAKFAERENAQRELYRAGQAVVPYLQSLDQSGLDAEQVARINAVTASLSVDYEDQAERVAAWLAGDERAWLALLDRDDPARRAVAAERLAQLLDAPVEFDAAADDATRGKQIEALRRKLERRQVPAPEDQN
jgi:hypothetical protein